MKILMIIINSLIILITNGNLNEKKNIRFNPPWKYYNILSSINFDKKHLFLTNNISESINHNLNQNFKYKYPTFNEWKNTIIKIADSFYNKNKSIERKDYVTKIIIFFYYIKYSKKEIKLIRYEEIKKINSIIVDEHNSLSISPLSELLNIEDNDSEELNIIDKDNNSSDSSLSLNENEDNSSENEEIFNEEILNLNQDNNNDFNDFKITIKNSYNYINYTDYENVVNDFLKNNIFMGKNK